jgi:hypothetical protein
MFFLLKVNLKLICLFSADFMTFCLVIKPEYVKNLMVLIFNFHFSHGFPSLSFRYWGEW